MTTGTIVQHPTLGQGVVISASSTKVNVKFDSGITQEVNISELSGQVLHS